MEPEPRCLSPAGEHTGSPLRLLRRAGEPDGDGGSLIRRAVDFDRAVQIVNKLLGDGQTEAGAAALARARLVDAVEALEDVGQIAFGDADAVIADTDLGAAVLFRGGNGDGAVLGRVFDRVDVDVDVDLPEPVVVGGDRRQLARDVERQR